ncbi:MAG: transporter, partial [Chloroflexota bacterium]|nr:transporter [Chloroflexota bacterium]
MIWLTWRRHRRTALIFGASIALLAAFFVVTGLLMHQAYYQQVGGVSLAMCDAQPQNPPPGCDALTMAFIEKWVPLSRYPLFALAFLPALAGIFLGAPLVAHDLETGTFRLAWTQSVTRLRWLGVM